MSDIVGGSVSLGRGDDQVVLMFSGMLAPDQWAAFIEAVIQAADNFGVAVKPFGQALTVQVRAVPVKPEEVGE
jgi:hypothetical protein